MPPDPDRQATITAYNLLRAAPLATLGARAIMVRELTGTDTHTANLAVCFNPLVNAYGVSEVAAVARNLVVMPGTPSSSIFRQGLSTPMRLNNMEFEQQAIGFALDNNLPAPPPNLVNPHRRTATARFGTVGEIWVTDLQSGCAVLILDWGGTYSMVHLQPSDSEEFNYLGGYLVSFGWSRDFYKKLWLQIEATQAVHNSMIGHAYPQRYIMVQSLRSMRASHRVQLIGIPNGANWNFYRQKINHGTYTVHSAEQLQWSGWYRRLEYAPYRYYD